MYEVQGTLTSPTPHPTPPQNSDIQKRAFYERGFWSAGKNMFETTKKPEFATQFQAIPKIL